MDAILNIFKSLDIDQTFFYQFALVVVLYAVLRSLFFSKLQEVLDLREAKTTKMEDGALGKLKSAEELAKKYKTKIDEAKSEAFAIIHKKKEEVVAREGKTIKEHEKALELKANQERKEFESEIEGKKASILSQAESLSQELVTKIIQ